MINKVIITNRTALESLYGNQYNEVIDAINSLIVADKARGIVSSLVFIDDIEQMTDFKSVPVTEVNNEKQNKDAVDAVHMATEAEFILLLGGPDIVPHQHLESPMKEILEDLYNGNKKSSFKLEDFPCDILKIASDLPYACETSYSNQVSTYLEEYKAEGFDGKSRYVGRIAGITGDKNSDSLINAIQTAIDLKPKDKLAYNDYFAVTTENPATNYADSILEAVFNNDKKLAKSPPNNFKEWKRRQINAPSHVIVCHGTPNIPYWYGEGDGNSKKKYAIALAPENVEGNISPNAIAAVLCCYGAQLYNPKDKLSKKYVDFLEQIGMQVNKKQEISLCNAYLQNRVAAYCGSTYFSSDVSILHYFLSNIFEGKTAGEALFDAQHQYIQENPEHMELAYLQTALAEFILLGDPSAQPIIHSDDKLELAEKHELRKNRKSRSISKTKIAISDSSALKQQEHLKPTKKVNKKIDKYIKKNKLKSVKIQSYQSEMKEGEITHVIQAVKKHHKKLMIPRIVTHIIKEQDGKVVAKRTMHTH